MTGKDRFMFRAWLENEKQIVKVIAVKILAGHMRITYFNTKSKQCEDCEYGFELMQCTGLADKNGKLVYEGDIIKGTAVFSEGAFEYCGSVTWYSESHLIGWYIVDYDGGGWELKQAQAKISLDNITGEIVGNIYENRELLKI